MREITRVVLVFADLGQSRHRADTIVPIADEIAQSDQRDVMPSARGFARQPDRCVIILFGRHAVDREGELDPVFAPRLGGHLVFGFGHGAGVSW